MSYEGSDTTANRQPQGPKRPRLRLALRKSAAVMAIGGVVGAGTNSGVQTYVANTLRPSTAAEEMIEDALEGAYGEHVDVRCLPQDTLQDMRKVGGLLEDTRNARGFGPYGLGTVWLTLDDCNALVDFGQHPHNPKYDVSLSYDKRSEYEGEHTLLEVADAALVAAHEYAHVAELITSEADANCFAGRSAHLVLQNMGAKPSPELQWFTTSDMLDLARNTAKVDGAYALDQSCWNELKALEVEMP